MPSTRPEGSPRARWLGRCDDWSVKDAHLFHDFDAGRREITYRTFRNHLGKTIIADLDERFGVPLRRDYHVRFYAGIFDGQRVVCLIHSAYHYLWTRGEPRRAKLDSSSKTFNLHVTR